MKQLCAWCLCGDRHGIRARRSDGVALLVCCCAVVCVPLCVSVCASPLPDRPPTASQRQGPRTTDQRDERREASQRSRKRGDQQSRTSLLPSRCHAAHVQALSCLTLHSAPLDCSGLTLLLGPPLLRASALLCYCPRHIASSTSRARTITHSTAI